MLKTTCMLRILNNERAHLIITVCVRVCVCVRVLCCACVHVAYASPSLSVWPSPKKLFSICMLTPIAHSHTATLTAEDLDAVSLSII